MSYATAAEVKAYSGLSEIAAKSDDDLNNKYIPRAERIINSYCRQNFNRSPLKIVTVDGSGSNRLELPERLVSLSQLRFVDPGAHAAQGNGLNNIDFATASHYSKSDDDKLEISGGKAQLAVSEETDDSWDFDTPADFTYDSAKIEIANSKARLLRGNNYPSVMSSYLRCDNNFTDNAPYANDVQFSDMAFDTGHIGSHCAVFNGSNSKLWLNDVDTNLRMGIGQDFSISCWFYITALPGANKTIVHHAGSGVLGWSLMITSSNNLRLSLENGTVVNVQYSLDSGILNQWNHVVCTIDRDALAKLWLNGVMVKSNNCSALNGLTLFRSADPDITWGSYKGADWFFDGKMDDLGIYKGKVFSEEEILDLYNGGTGRNQGLYPTDYPTLKNAVGYPYSSNWDRFITTFNLPTGSNIRYVLSPDDGVTFYYYSGGNWIVSDESFSQANVAADVDDHIDEFPSSGTLVGMSILSSTDGYVSPELSNIQILGNAYPTDDNLYVDTTDDSEVDPDDFLSWLNMVITYLTPTGTAVGILISLDNRVTWIGWNGIRWTTVSASTLRANATSLTDAQNKFSYLDAKSPINVRLFLYTSDRTKTPEYSNIQFENLSLSKNSVVNNVSVDQVFNKNWYLMADSEPVRARQRIGKQERLEDALIFPMGFENIEITGYFGYSSVPDEVKEALCEVVERIVVNESSGGKKHGTFNKEKIGDYSYEKGGNNSTDRDGMISGSAKDLLREYRKPILISRI